MADEKKTEVEALIWWLEHFQGMLDEEQKDPESWTGQTEHEVCMFIPRLLAALQAASKTSKALRFDVEEATRYAPPDATDEQLLNQYRRAFEDSVLSNTKLRAALGKICVAVDEARF